MCQAPFYALEIQQFKKILTHIYIIYILVEGQKQQGDESKLSI